MRNRNEALGFRSHLLDQLRHNALRYEEGLADVQSRSQRSRGSIIGFPGIYARTTSIRFIQEELKLHVKSSRFIWVWANQQEMAVVRAYMPGNPMIEPRDLWDEL